MSVISWEALLFSFLKPGKIFLLLIQLVSNYICCSGYILNIYSNSTSLNLCVHIMLLGCLQSLYNNNNKKNIFFVFVSFFIWGYKCFEIFIYKNIILKSQLKYIVQWYIMLDIWEQKILYIYLQKKFQLQYRFIILLCCVLCVWIFMEYYSRRYTKASTRWLKDIYIFSWMFAIFISFLCIYETYIIYNFSKLARCYLLNKWLSLQTFHKIWVIFACTFYTQPI